MLRKWKFKLKHLLSHHYKQGALAKCQPKTICILRLSALGDITHILPVINTIRSSLPKVKISWIIGAQEAELVKDIPGIEFITFEKHLGWRAYLQLRRKLIGRKFDVLLLIQLSLRASLASLFIKARLRVGFDRARSKELHGLFISCRVKPHPEPHHVIDGFFDFTRALGIKNHCLVWDQCFNDENLRVAKRYLDHQKKTLLISPCSRHAYRWWDAGSCAEVADYAADRHGMKILLSSSKNEQEKNQLEKIRQKMRHKPEMLPGTLSLKELAALISEVDVLLTVDSAPVHLANFSSTPVIGLYATSNPQFIGPKIQAGWCIDHYPEATAEHLKKWSRRGKTMPWGKKIKNPEVMNLIKTKEVCARLDQIIATCDPRLASIECKR